MFKQQSRMKNEGVNMKSRILSLVVFLVFVLMITAGCGTAANNSSDGKDAAANGSGKSAKDTLKIAYSDSPDSLDCNLTSINMSEKMCANIYGTLLKFDGDYKPQPYIAKSWEISPDGLTYTFKLRDDVKFHDGKKLTAKDVVYSLKKSQESAFNGAFLAPVKEFKQVDDYTVSLVLVAPYAPLLNVLCEPLIGIFNEETYNAAGDSFKTKPISCGPYKVAEWLPENKIVLERFDDFFEGPAPIKTIEVRLIPDETTKGISIENGEVDAAENISTTDRQNIMNNKKLNFFETPSTKYFHMAINNENGKLGDVKVRQALSYAVNKKAVIDTAMDGIGQEAVCTVNDKCFGFPANFTEYEYNTEKAKQLLAEAGKTGLKIEIIIKYSELNKKMAETIQADLNKGGFDCSIKISEAGGFSDAIEKGNYDLCLLTWSDSLMDADAIVAYRFDSKFMGFAGNWSRIKDAKLEKLVVDARSTNDVEKRKEYYKQMFEYVRDQAFEKPLFYSMNNLAANKDLKIKKALPTGIYYYNDWSW